MARMIRKQIVIDAERDALVARIAGERGTSQSEVIRLAIDALAGEMHRIEAEEARELERHRVFEELLDSFRSAGNLGLTDEAGSRTWTREELYEHRGSR